MGSGLIIQPPGFAILQQLGLADALPDRGARADRMRGRAGSSGRVVLDARYRRSASTPVPGGGVHRATLFALPSRNVVAEGIAVETGCVVAESEFMSADRRHLLLGNGRRIGPSDLVKPFDATFAFTRSHR